MKKTKRRRDQGDENGPALSLAILSERELEILRLFVEGLPAKKIMAILGISRGTINTHTERIYRKLGVTCRAQAVVWYCRFLRTNAPDRAKG